MQEMDILLHNHAMKQDPLAAEVASERARAVQLLEESLGFHAGVAGSGTVMGYVEPVLDVGYFGSILATIKGRKLIAQCMHFLSPQHCWAMLPTILSKVLQYLDVTSNLHMMQAEKQLLWTCLLVRLSPSPTGGD